jgi:hypothetical protein
VAAGPVPLRIPATALARAAQPFRHRAFG